MTATELGHATFTRYLFVFVEIETSGQQLLSRTCCNNLRSSESKSAASTRFAMHIPLWLNSRSMLPASRAMSCAAAQR